MLIPPRPFTSCLEIFLLSVISLYGLIRSSKSFSSDVAILSVINAPLPTLNGASLSRVFRTLSESLYPVNELFITPLRESLTPFSPLIASLIFSMNISDIVAAVTISKASISSSSSSPAINALWQLAIEIISCGSRVLPIRSDLFISRYLFSSYIFDGSLIPLMISENSG